MASRWYGPTGSSCKCCAQGCGAYTCTTGNPPPTFDYVRTFNGTPLTVCECIVYATEASGSKTMSVEYNFYGSCTARDITLFGTPYPTSVAAVAGTYSFTYTCFDAGGGHSGFNITPTNYRVHSELIATISGTDYWLQVFVVPQVTIGAVLTARVLGVPAGDPEPIYTTSGTSPGSYTGASWQTNASFVYPCNMVCFCPDYFFGITSYNDGSSEGPNMGALTADGGSV